MYNMLELSNCQASGPISQTTWQGYCQSRQVKSKAFFSLLQDWFNNGHIYKVATCHLIKQKCL
jgi:hypothetical protein